MKLANRMNNVSGVAIGEILKLAADPSVIAFGTGNPSPDTFPVEAMRSIIDNALKEQPIKMLQYSQTEGYAPLRQTLTKHLKKRFSIGMDFDNTLIVSGSQQAADLVSKCLLNENDVVICENPSFMGCLNTFRSYGAKLVGIPMQNDGMNIEKLEQALKSNFNVKLIYIIPTFQNPTGLTTSLEKRQLIYNLAVKYNVMILEDNPYGELRFEGKEILPIKSMDKDGIVIYCGSFSKVIAPAFRIGYVTAVRWLFDAMCCAKQCSDVHTNVVFQHTCYEFMERYDYEDHIKKICEMYREKCNLMFSQLSTKLHPSFSLKKPEGGLFIMVYMPDGEDSEFFVKQAIKNKVACIPGSIFMSENTAKSNAFRVNFATPNGENIVNGATILGELSYQWYK